MNDASAPTGAGTRLAVLHRTTFHYEHPVELNTNTLKLEPRTFPYQKTLSALIRVLPAIRLHRFHDLFDNITHHFELVEPHRKLEIESRIRVHNLPLDFGEDALTGPLSLLTGDVATRERIWPYLQPSRRVNRLPEVWWQARSLTAGITPVYQQARAIMEWIHTAFRYAPGSTKVQTTLAEAFALRSGVCQDFTHVMLGLCREVGLPARYASGYLYNGPRDTLVGAQASHAWCEVYLPGAGWIGFDPTNNNLADDRYVKVAVGRDYDDVAPVAGSFHGSGACHMDVVVAVEHLP